MTLEDTRAQLGISTQVGFAHLLGISPQQYRRIISGASGTTDTLRLLTQAYLAGYRPENWNEHAHVPARKKRSAN